MRLPEKPYSSLFFANNGTLDLQRFRETAVERARSGEVCVIHFHPYLKQCQGNEHHVYYPPLVSTAEVRVDVF
jgi:hypothetical protein